jgi:hypothetical protein
MSVVNSGAADYWWLKYAKSILFSASHSITNLRAVCPAEDFFQPLSGWRLFSLSCCYGGSIAGFSALEVKRKEKSWKTIFRLVMRWQGPILSWWIRRTAPSIILYRFLHLFPVESQHVGQCNEPTKQDSQCRGSSSLLSKYPPSTDSLPEFVCFHLCLNVWWAFLYPPLLVWIANQKDWENEDHDLTRFSFSFSCKCAFGWWIQVDEHYMFDLFHWFFLCLKWTVWETRRSEPSSRDMGNAIHLPSLPAVCVMVMEKKNETVHRALEATHIYWLSRMSCMFSFPSSFFYFVFFSPKVFTMGRHWGPSKWKLGPRRKRVYGYLSVCVEAVSQVFTLW